MHLTTGPSGGLRLMMSAEQFDYSRGTQGTDFAAGLRVRIHDSNNKPYLMSENTFLVGVGTETVVSLLHEKV